MASKDILWEGTWTYPDGRVLRVTPERIANACHNGTRMLKSGLPLPWCWDHQPGVMPIPVQMSARLFSDPNARAAVARNTINLDTTGLRVEERDHRGRRRKVLVADFDDSKLDESQKAQVRAAGKVSCRLDENFHDARGNGRVYAGLSVSHIAVTPKALEPDQGPFQMSATVPELARGKSDRHWYMASGKNDDEPDGDDATGEFETTPDADDLDDDLADLPGPEMPPPPPPPPPLPVGPPPEMADIMASLSAMGLPLPADQISDLTQLAMALKIAAGLGGQLKGAPGAGDPDADLTASVGAGATPPMMMSQSAMLARAPDRVAVDRGNVRAKIARLHKRGKIPGPTHDALVRDFESFEMSYGAGGRVATTGFLRDLVALDRYLPTGVFGRRSQGERYDLSVSGLTADAADLAEVPPPAQFRDRDGTAKLGSLMEEAYARHGLAKPAA